eukprot:1771919-Alexandrium_andersonii.AAC.1
MEGIEAEADDEEVFVFDQPGRSSAEAAAHSRTFADRLRQKTAQAAKVKKTVGRNTSAPASRKLPRPNEPA